VGAGYPVLLYHWKCVLRGYAPFKLARENPEELHEKDHIDAEGLQYMAKVADIFATDDDGKHRKSSNSSSPLTLRGQPFAGLASTHCLLSSEWITKLFKEVGA
jgi:hypothetical protein